MADQVPTEELEKLKGTVTLEIVAVGSGKL
jgi:hypothetical protein